MPKGQNSKPKTGFGGSRKPVFRAWKTRFSDFGQNRVCNPSTDTPWVGYIHLESPHSLVWNSATVSVYWQKKR
jgi:hypothetical protein